MFWNPKVIGEHSSYGLLRFSRFSGKTNVFDEALENLVQDVG